MWALLVCDASIGCRNERMACAQHRLQRSHQQWAARWCGAPDSLSMGVTPARVHFLSSSLKSGSPVCMSAGRAQLSLTLSKLLGPR